MTKELLEKLRKAKTNEEFKQIVKDDKTILTSEELKKVGGGLVYLDTDETRKEL